MVTEIQVNKFKFMPEVVFATDAEDFLAGGKTLVRLKNLNERQQFVEPLSYSLDAVDNVLVSHVLDSKSEPELDSGSLRGITEDNELAEFVPYAFIFDEYRFNANNNAGGTQSDFRSRLRYVVHQLTTVRKLANKVTLTKDDRDAIEILSSKGLVDLQSKFQIGFDLPKNFSEDFNDKNVDAVQRAYTPGLDLSTADRKELINFDVEKGQCAVLKSLFVEVPLKAEVGEVQGFISRDDDDDIIQFDPAALNDGATNGQAEIKCHIPAYKNIKVEFLLASGAPAHNNFKAWAGVSIKRVGLMTKAKLLEFSKENFPNVLTVSSADERIIEEQSLQQLARIGADVLR